MARFSTWTLLLLLSVFPHLALAQPDPETPPPAPNKAVEVEIRGGLAGFDREAYATVRAILASLVMDGTAEHMVTTVRGLEGGGKFCVQLAPLALPRLSSILTQFQALQVDPHQP